MISNSSEYVDDEGLLGAKRSTCCGAKTKGGSGIRNAI